MTGSKLYKNATYLLVEMPDFAILLYFMTTVPILLQ